MIKKFMENYGTLENYLRCYGGIVSVDNSKSQSDKKGNLVIYFDRPVVFPTDLLKQYNSAYVEHVPELKPTQAELNEIHAQYEEY